MPHEPRILDREFKYARRGYEAAVKVVYGYWNDEYHTLVFLRDSIDGFVVFALHGKADDWQVISVVDAYYTGMNDGWREGKAHVAEKVLTLHDELAAIRADQRERDARSKR